MAAYDRTSFKLLWENEIKPEKGLHHFVYSLTFANNKIQAWLGHQYPQRGHPDLAIINPDNGKFTLRTLQNGFDGAMETPSGFAFCHAKYEAKGPHDISCGLLDKKTLKPIESDINRNQDLFELLKKGNAVDQKALADIIVSSNFETYSRFLIGLNNSWIARSDPMGGVYDVSFRSLKEPD